MGLFSKKEDTGGNYPPTLDEIMKYLVKGGIDVKKNKDDGSLYIYRDFVCFDIFPQDDGLIIDYRLFKANRLAEMKDLDFSMLQADLVRVTKDVDGSYGGYYFVLTKSTFDMTPKQFLEHIRMYIEDITSTCAVLLKV